MLYLWNTGGLPYPKLHLTTCCFNDNVSLFTQYHVNSISKSIPCFFSGASLLLGAIHFKTKLATFCKQAYFAFFTHGFCIDLHILQRVEKLVFGSGSFYQISRSVEVQLLRPVYFWVPSLF